MDESFHRRMGSSSLARNLLSCSASLTENQYFRSKMPSSTSRRSKIGHWCRNRPYSSLLQKPITRSTPARLYQLRSNSTISPASGQVLDIALEIPLGLLALGRRGQRDDPGDPGVEERGHPLDRAALACRIPALEDHHDPGPLGPAPTPAASPALPAGGTARPRRPSCASAPAGPTDHAAPRARAPPARRARVPRARRARPPSRVPRAGRARLPVVRRCAVVRRWPVVRRPVVRGSLALRRLPGLAVTACHHRTSKQERLDPFVRRKSAAGTSPAIRAITRTFSSAITQDFSN